MEKRILKLASLFFVLISLASCRYIDDDFNNNGRSSDLVFETIPLKNFDKVELGSNFDVVIRRGNNFRIEVNGDRFDVRDLEAVVTNKGKLVINYRNNGMRRYDMLINITMPELVEADIFGAADADIRGFNQKYMGIFGSGSTDIYVDADADIFDIAGTGNSDIKMVGNGDEMYVEMSGTADLNARNLFVRDADVLLSGSSDIIINASKLIYGQASGACSIRYRSNPTVDVLLSGSSFVRRD